ATDARVNRYNSRRRPPARAAAIRGAVKVPLNRALSKLGILSRSAATAAIRAGRIRVDGRIVLDPSRLVIPERARLALDDRAARPARWRTILLYKPRGVV